MVQWGDPALEDRLAIIDAHMKFLLLGIYGWEYLQSLDVEYAIIRRRLSFRWPLIPYLAGRLTLLTTLVLITIGQTPVAANFACQPAITSAAVLGNSTMASSSANFMIRTWLIWKNSRLVHILLLLATLGHWTILALDVANIQAFTSNGVCAPYIVQSMMSAAIFTYTMFYDFFVFVLSILKLSKQPSKSPLEGHLRSQCLLYFAVAVMANIIPTVFGFLGSASMVSITGCCATTASTIVSCRAVKSLLDLRIPHSSRALDGSIERDAALTTEIAITEIPSIIPTNV